MIYHSFDDEEIDRSLIGLQTENLHYTYLHWDYAHSSKYRLDNYNTALTSFYYLPVGPTVLVEWLHE